MGVSELLGFRDNRGFRDYWGLGFIGVQGLGFRFIGVWGLGCRIYWGLGFRVSELGFIGHWVWECQPQTHRNASNAPNRERR